MVVTYKNWVRATPPRYMQVSRDKIEGLKIDFTMMPFHNRPNAHTKSNHRWTHVRSKNRLSTTRAPWQWHRKIRCEEHPQDTCKCQGIKLRVYNWSNSVQSMAKTRHDNDMTDHLGLLYTKNETELSWPIQQGKVYDEDRIGERHD